MFFLAFPRFSPIMPAESEGCLVVPAVFNTVVGRLPVQGGFDSYPLRQTTCQTPNTGRNTDFSMNNDYQLGHTDETHNPLSQMPKRSYVEKRGNIFYFRLRIPKELIAPDFYNGKTQVRESLRTKDEQTAYRLAACREAELRAEFSQRRRGERRQAGGPKPKPWKRKHEETDTSKLRPLSSLNTKDHKQVILNRFIEMERRSANARLRINGEVTHEIIDDARIDLAVCEGSYPTEPIDWGNALSAALLSAGIHADDKESEDFKLLCNYFKHACIENAWRNVAALEGEVHPQRDRIFKGYGFDSPYNETVATGQVNDRQSITIEQLCSAFLDAKTKEGRSNATMNKYPNTFKVVIDFWGGNRTIESISREDAVQMAEFLSTIPIHATKRYPNTSLVEAAKQEGQKAFPAFISPKQQHDHLNTISSLFHYPR